MAKTPANGASGSKSGAWTAKRRKEHGEAMRAAKARKAAAPADPRMSEQVVAVIRIDKNTDPLDLAFKIARAILPRN